MVARRRCWRLQKRLAKPKILAKLAADYPQGPHDQPQSMCPGLRRVTRRSAHAQGRDDSVRLRLLCLRPDLYIAFLWGPPQRRLCAVRFRNIGHRPIIRRHPQGRAAKPRGRKITMLSSLLIFASRPLPACRSTYCRRKCDGVRIIGIDVPGFGVPTHAEAKDVLAGAMLKYARTEAERGAVPRPRAPLGRGQENLADR